MSSKEITIISTNTWDEGTLFDGSVKVTKTNSDIDICEEYFKNEPDWTSLFTDGELKDFYEVIKDKVPDLGDVTELQTIPKAREDAIKDSEIKEKLINIIITDPNKFDKVKESICAIGAIDIYKVKDVDVYGIKALKDSKPASEWIPFLLRLARTLIKDNGTLSVNLFLHDKDVGESSYRHDFIKEPNLENLLPEGKSLKDYNVQNCTVIFYKHNYNSIFNFISRKPDGDLSESIEKIKQEADNIQAMVDDYKKVNPESSKQEKPDGGLSESIEKIKQAAINLLSVVDDYKEINSESSNQGTRED